MARMEQVALRGVRRVMRARTVLLTSGRRGAVWGRRVECEVVGLDFELLGVLVDDFVRAVGPLSDAVILPL